ncbi:MAG: polysaccharide biosynthesis protein [Planctomycetia bacterium]|nr:polysaccharide biosynthesis protein [Planctomycetia bacterium]
MNTDALPLQRINRRAVVLLGVHAAIFAGIFAFAFFLRSDFSLQATWQLLSCRTLLGVVAIKTCLFYALGHCHVSWRRVAFSDLTALVWAATLSMLVLVTVESLVLTSGRLGAFTRVPRSVFVLDWAGTVLMIGGVRALWRSIREELRPIFTSRPVRTALVVGADEAGDILARNLTAATRMHYVVVGYIDDDPGLQRTRVAGLEVLGTTADVGRIAERRRVDEVVVHSGRLTGRAFRRLLEDCKEHGTQVKVMPAIDELLTGSDNASHLRPRSVEIRDLLRREPVRLDIAAVRQLIEGQTVMVTGAGGSIGSEICRQVLRFQPRELLLVERGENALFLLEQELGRREPRPPFEPLIADVTDAQRMEQIIATHRPAVIFHAAAHKHVPMMEWNPAEAIKNNCLGTQLLARLADAHGVGAFVMISTDKAVNPTSVMGCSKLIAERFVQAMAGVSKTRFLVVRFGNVLASNGSVVPIFQEQIRLGGPVTITHPEISRYFMMIPEASQLVLQAAAMGRGGEIFVLDMGESVKIVDLARDLIALSGLGEDDIEIVFTGLRPGEKLYEELYFDDEQRLPTDHPKVFCAMHRPVTVEAAEGVIAELSLVLDDPPEAIKLRLAELLPEYEQVRGDRPPPAPPKAHAK